MAHGLSCSVACGILVPLPGIKPESPASQGGFLTTGPVGKSLLHFLVSSVLWNFCDLGDQPLVGFVQNLPRTGWL